MLATLTEPAPLGAGWIYEPKLDGVRCLVVAGPGIHLWSRNRKALDGAYPELVEALGARVRGGGVFDGEVVAIDPGTRLSSFSRLQRRMQQRDPRKARLSGVPVELWLFDCLFYEGLDLRGRPLEERRQVLLDAVQTGGPIRHTPMWTSLEPRFSELCRRGGEGVIAKRLASRYVAGRSRDWLKLKCVAEQEFVVGGWTDPKGSREWLGALLVGYYDGDELRYAGKVGTGYDRDQLEALHAALAARARVRSPFRGEPAPREAGVHWVAPTLVVQIGFGEWTPDGLLRHPRFLGVRDDKAAREVVRERPDQRARGR
jgi:DNA ligase D-like protein (predicted ligase)